MFIPSNVLNSIEPPKVAEKSWIFPMLESDVPSLSPQGVLTPIGVGSDGFEVKMGAGHTVSAYCCE